MSKKIISMLLCIVLCLSCLFVFASCGGDSNNTGNNAANTDTLVIMTETLDGVFNPFFSTSANDGTIVAMTQIGMLTSKYVNNSVEVAYGDNEAVVTKDFEYVTDASGDTTYTFVLKNGIKFSDGHPLTMEDVLFNLYVYLDPVYTGSSTIYSTDIKGLADYRAQKYLGEDNNEDNSTSDMAASRAQDRINTLIQIFKNAGKTETMTGESYSITIEDMKAAIAQATIDRGYKNAIATPAEQNSGNINFNDQLLADYELTLEKFQIELERDYASAMESYTDEPYKSHDEFKDEVFCFMYQEGYVEVEYNKQPGSNKDDKSSIKTLTPLYSKDVVKDKASAINFVYNDKVSSELHMILSYWATATELRTEYSAKAMEVILAENIKDGELAIESISGIVSLGHNTDVQTVTVNGNTYTVAQEHNPDGTPKLADTYDVLQITINDVDPKAHWNFSFTVAPQHYYGSASIPVDIENNKFGVQYGSFEFMKNVVQSTRNVKLPMGAGAYKVTNRSNDDNPAEGDFYTNGIVYFKANNYFETVGAGLNNAKIGKIRYQVVSANNAITALEEGSVHYITPQLTDDNYDKLVDLGDDGIKFMTSDQLGYGYIGINASKIQDLNIRKAIMCAMNTKQALEFYRPGTATQIYWPMSLVSWAYPKDSLMDNGHDYPQLNGSWFDSVAEANIKKYMEAAGVTAGDSELKITFTIAGSNLQEHPVYKTFRDAAILLNNLGWDVTVTPDTQALTKINSGSLEVWAAAWGSTIDPDMYQVYHKNSTAGSTNAWGYPYIKTSGTDEEKDILNELSELIDKARETTDQTVRTEYYEQAMSKVLDLAIELPVYQRSQLYAYNANVIDSDSLPSEINPYTSPIDRIWELDFKK